MKRRVVGFVLVLAVLSAILMGAGPGEILVVNPQGVGSSAPGALEVQVKHLSPTSREVQWSEKVDPKANPSQPGVQEVCVGFVQADWAEAPNLKYRGGTRCTLGFPPRRITRFMTVRALATPNLSSYVYREVAANPQASCTAFGTCYTQWYTLANGGQSRRVQIEMRWQTGNSQFTGWSEWYYNRNGVGYPQHAWPVIGELWFPDPYYACPAGICQTRAENFATNVVIDWQSRRIPIPPQPFEVHHVKPLACNGDNSTYNGYILPRDFHRTKINPWWSGVNCSNA